MTRASDKPEPTKSSARAQQARQTYERIKTVALELFATDGYDATSLQDIADEMGLTKAAVYYHFRSKARILEAVIVPAYDEMTALLARIDLLTDRDERRQAMTTGTVNILLSQRSVMSLLSSDPVMHSHIQAVRPMDEILERVIDVLYGPVPTLEHRLAVYAVAGLARASSALHDVTGEQLRPALHNTVQRLLESS